MKKLLFSLLISLLPLPLASQSLSEALQMALENNSQIKAARLQSASVKKELLSLERGYLPAVSLKASYAHISDVPQFEIPLPGISKTITLNPQDNYETGLQLDYVVFSGFAQKESYRVKEFEHKISLANENQNDKDIALNTIRAYRNAQFMELSLDILEKAKERSLLQMQKIKALLENGMALRLDTLSLALNRMEIEQQIIQSESVLDNWLQLLETLSGNAINPQKINDQKNVNLSNGFSMEEQNAFKTIQLQQLKMNAFKAMARSAYYPKVWLSASFNYGKPGIDIIKNEWSTYGKWMVGLQWNIWNWRADQAAVQSRELQYQSLEHAQQSIIDQLKLQYDKATRSFTALSKSHMVALQAVKVAREKMQIIETNTQNGQLSASDFNEANLELSQAELKQKQIWVQLNLQASEMDYLSGKPVNTWRL